MSNRADDLPTTAQDRDPVPDSQALSVWEDALEVLSEEMDTPSFKVWFEGTVPTHLEGDALTIVVPNSFAKEYITDRFKSKIESALSTTLGPTASLVIEVKGEPESPAAHQKQLS